MEGKVFFKPKKEGTQCDTADATNKEHLLGRGGERVSRPKGARF